MTISSTKTLLDVEIAAAIADVRRSSPLIHCITNIVVAGFSANVLLAIGASPAMVENAEESKEFAAIASALLINLGTLSSERVQAMRAAARSAEAAGTPWVLDPVAVGALSFRTEFAKTLLEFHPSVIRGNASEIMSLAGAQGASGKGVDSTALSDDALIAAKSLASASKCVVAVSGAIDYVVDESKVIAVPGGHELMTKVTGIGCALGAVMAAYCAVMDDALMAATCASALVAKAGERAGHDNPGPGTFALRFIDQLSFLSTPDASAIL